MLPRVFLVLSGLLGGPVLAEPRFEPVAPPDHVYSGGWEHFVGGGLAVLDCNKDGLSDVFAAGGSNTARLLLNRSVPGGQVQLVKATPPNLKLTSVTGAYPLDIDSDGQSDLVILRAGTNLLMRGLPDCAFAPFTDLGFVSEDRWTTAFSATWEPGQSLPTLAFGNYVDRTNPDGPFRACDDNMLYRPEGKSYSHPLFLTPGYCALSMLFSDWGRQGRSDLRVSNDRHYYVDEGQEQMWAMQDRPRLLGESDGWINHRLWGMGIASRDLTGDGLPEIMLTSMGDQRLQELTRPDRPTYGDVPFERGTTAHRPHAGGDGRPSTGWHAAFADIDNDGRDDIFISKGNVDQMPDSAMKDPNSLLMQSADGNFAEFAEKAGLASLQRGRGAALVDLNVDGLLDVMVLNRRAPLEIWQNVSPGTGSWLNLVLTQSAPNTRAVGAWIELETDAQAWAREITVGGGHASGVSAPEHFGLGNADNVNVRVIWPDGSVSNWVQLGVNKTVRLFRQSGGALGTDY